MELSHLRSIYYRSSNTLALPMPSPFPSSPWQMEELSSLMPGILLTSHLPGTLLHQFFSPLSCMLNSLCQLIHSHLLLWLIRFLLLKPTTKTFNLASPSSYPSGFFLAFGIGYLNQFVYLYLSWYLFVYIFFYKGHLHILATLLFTESSPREKGWV